MLNDKGHVQDGTRYAKTEPWVYSENRVKHETDRIYTARQEVSAGYTQQVIYSKQSMDRATHVLKKENSRD